MDNTTAKRSFRLAAVVGAVLLFGLGLTWAWEEYAASGQPSRAPDIQGRVVKQGGPGFLVESPAGGQLWIRPPRSECIRTRNGDAGSLEVGHQVTVWTGSAIRETFPAQADAVWAIIETEPEDPKAQ